MASMRSAVHRHHFSALLPRVDSDGDETKEGDTSKRRRGSSLCSLYNHKHVQRNTFVTVLLVLIPLACYYVYVQATSKRAQLLAAGIPKVHPSVPLDFIVAGFPKCGTTTLLYALHKHPEVAMSPIENCQIARPIQQDDVNLKRLNKDLLQLDATPDVSNDVIQKKRGIKCPDALHTYKVIHRLAQHSPSCKFVIGVRHPIQMLQSFYNYRITEIYDKSLPKDNIPDLVDILQGTVPIWKDVSIDVARFELYLLQLAKTALTLADLETLQEHDWLAVKPNRFDVFLYTLDQINDEDVSRAAAFRGDLQSFLGLSNPLEPLGHENLNHFVGGQAHTETIDICEPHFDGVREALLRNSQATAAWIRTFIDAPTVTVSNCNHVLESLSAWDVDPCSVEETR